MNINNKLIYCNNYCY